MAPGKTAASKSAQIRSAWRTFFLRYIFLFLMVPNCVRPEEVFTLVLEVDQAPVTIVITEREDAQLKAAEFCTEAFGDPNFQSCKFRVASRLEKLQGIDAPEPRVQNCAVTGNCLQEVLPFNVIQTWKDTSIPPELRTLNVSVLEMIPHAQFLFFSDKDILAFVNTHFPEYFDMFVGLEHKIMQIDFFRYLAIYELGGLYLDLDIVVESSLDSSLDMTKAIFPIEQKCGPGHKCHHTSQKNALQLLPDERDTSVYLGQYAFYAPRHHPFLKEVIKNCVMQHENWMHDGMAGGKMQDNFERHIHEMTGNALITRTYAEFVEKDTVQLLAPVPFSPFQFGKYARHMAFGSWKYVRPKLQQAPLRVS